MPQFANAGVRRLGRILPAGQVKDRPAALPRAWRQAMPVWPAGQASTGVSLPPGVSVEPVQQEGASASVAFVAAVAGGLLVLGGLAYALTRSPGETTPRRRHRRRSGRR